MSAVSDAIFAKIVETLRRDRLTTVVRDLDDFRKDAEARGARFENTAVDAWAGAYYLDTSFYPDADWSDYPTYSAIISPERSKDDQVISLIHEWGHHRCRRGHCPCSAGCFFTALAEPHAHEHTLRELAAFDLPVLTQRYLLLVLREARYFRTKGAWDTDLITELDVLLLRRDRLTANRLKVVAPENSRHYGNAEAEEMKELYDDLGLVPLQAVLNTINRALGQLGREDIRAAVQEFVARVGC